MTPMTVSPKGGGARIANAALLSLSLLALVAVLCFCSLFPVALLLSFVFNALVLGSSLFAAMAQEREKRTIDALRLTQLSSMDILYLKSRRELGLWKRGNVVLTGLMLLAGLQGGVSALWVLSGAAALAAGGLLSIALALAVSTRSETTSSAVVTGWVTKGAWLVGLPLLDQVFEAVFVTDSSVALFRYLDPAWVAFKVSQASVFELNSSALVSLWIGILATVALAGVAVWTSSQLIDASFESAATLEDRRRHAAYSKSYPSGLSDNAFFVREIAWQIRTGAGRWPGYAVFLTLFLAPFLYGVAQSQKEQLEEPPRVIRQGVLQQSVVDTSVPTGYFEEPGASTVVSSPPQVHPQHTGLCFSRMIGLPVNRTVRLVPGQVTVVTSSGSIRNLDEADLGSTLSNVGKSSRLERHRATLAPSQLEYELQRGLWTGLLLSILYLFVRGGAFMASSVTGEKERRAWDQIALTGVTPETYVGGKLAAVLFHPLRQILMASPALLLFVAFGVLTVTEWLGVVLLLLSSLLAAGALGIAMSSLSPTSHQAQGAALGISAAFLLLPLLPSVWGFLLIGAGALLFKARVSAEATFATLAALWVAGLVGGPMLSPLAAVMALCGSSLGTSSMIVTVAGTGGAVLWSALSMVFVAGLFYRVAVASLREGGSVRA